MTPDEHTNQEFYLSVGDGHRLYVQDWGLKSAKKPIIFVHGGPGGGVKNRYRDSFDPQLHRVIFFDQRGAGQSTPTASLEANTTQHLVGDIDKIADALNLKRFSLCGGSWGSCLALCYGIAHPDRVAAMYLRGIFTARASENEWLYKGGFRTFFPETWHKYQASVPERYKNNPTSYHLPRILGTNAAAARASAYIFTQVEGALLALDDRFTPPDLDSFEPTLSLIEAHYLAHEWFLSEHYIFDHAKKLSMPVYLIQGRYDMVCPPITAYELHQRLPNSHLLWTLAGHANDRSTFDVNRTLLMSLGA